MQISRRDKILLILAGLGIEEGLDYLLKAPSFLPQPTIYQLDKICAGDEGPIRLRFTHVNAELGWRHTQMLDAPRRLNRLRKFAVCVLGAVPTYDV